MNEKYLSQRELGTLYGVSSHVIGRWLKDFGLRTDDGSPSFRAFNEGYVSKRSSTQPGTYFYVWHRDKTSQLFDRMGYAITN